MNTHKHILFLATIFILLICSPANAEDAVVDYSSMSFEELIEINTQVTNELVKRGDNRFALLPSGEYLVGRDIAPGQYKISLHKIGDNAWLDVTIYHSGITPEKYNDAISASYDERVAYEKALEAGKDVEMPERLNSADFLAMDMKILMDNGDISVSLEDGQTLLIKVQYDCVATIEKTKGLFMD